MTGFYKIQINWKYLQKFSLVVISVVLLALLTTRLVLPPIQLEAMNFCFLSQTSHNNDKATDNGSIDGPWAKAPRFTLSIRMYSGSVQEYWQVFAPSYLMFWPQKRWKNSDLVLVFDEESLNDHQTSTVLSILPPYPKIVFEKLPPPGTLCSNWRREGYSRQMYSNFYADNYTDAEFIGMCDTDSYFSTKVVVEDLFENGKPRIMGYNGCCVLWQEAAAEIIGGKRIGEFMIFIGFPFVVKRQHFKLFREYVTKTFKKATFEEWFHQVCSTHIQYSQYGLLAYYLFEYHLDEYAWHIRDQNEANHPAFQKRITDDPVVLSKSAWKVGLMRNAPGHGHFEHLPFVIYDYVCTAANFSEQVGSCSREPVEYRDDIRHSVERNLLTDMNLPTAHWAERALPRDSPLFYKTEEKIPLNSQEILDKRAKYSAPYEGSWHW